MRRHPLRTLASDRLRCKDHQPRLQCQAFTRLLLLRLQAAGLKHIGFGPFKRENQDEFFIQVGDFGGQPSSNLFCVFDGHGSHGKDAALYSRQILPRLLDIELARYFEVSRAGT